MTVPLQASEKDDPFKGAPSFSLGHRLIRLVWGIIWALLASWTPAPMHRWRIFLLNLFGIENLFHITREEMYHMYSNVFSIAPNIVVSEKNFVRLNNWLRENGFTVEEIPYAEIAKQEGLLRCSTMPLIRD